jgi:hypothetical protein
MKEKTNMLIDLKTVTEFKMSKNDEFLNKSKKSEEITIVQRLPKFVPYSIVVEYEDKVLF